MSHFPLASSNLPLNSRSTLDIRRKSLVVGSGGSQGICGYYVRIQHVPVENIGQAFTENALTEYFNTYAFLIGNARKRGNNKLERLCIELKVGLILLVGLQASILQFERQASVFPRTIGRRTTIR